MKKKLLLLLWLGVNYDSYVSGHWTRWNRHSLTLRLRSSISGRSSGGKSKVGLLRAKIHLTTTSEKQNEIKFQVTIELYK